MATYEIHTRSIPERSLAAISRPRSAGQRRPPAGALRQVLIADQRSATRDTLVCDLTVPLK